MVGLVKTFNISFNESSRAEIFEMLQILGWQSKDTHTTSILLVYSKQGYTLRAGFGLRRRADCCLALCWRLPSRCKMLHVDFKKCFEINDSEESQAALPRTTALHLRTQFAGGNGTMRG